jgi:hypothetical protein
MGTTYHGSLTLGGATVGLSAAFDALDAALAKAKLVIDAQVSALATAKAAIRLAMLADINASLDAAAGIQASFGVGDITALASAVLEVKASIEGMLPSVVIDASASLSLELEAKIAGVDLLLEVLLDISAALSGVLNVALPALSAAASLSAALTSPGVHVFTYDGPIEGLGASLDAEVSSSSGLAPGTTIKAPLLVVNTGDASATAALKLALLTTP